MLAAQVEGQALQKDVCVQGWLLHVLRDVQACVARWPTLFVWQSQWSIPLHWLQLQSWHWASISKAFLQWTLPLQQEIFQLQQSAKKADYEKSRSNSKVPCPIHSFPDKPTKHTWTECLENPANQRKPALQSRVNAHHTTTNNCYLSNDDKSAMDSSYTGAAEKDNNSVHCCLFSDNNDKYSPFRLLLSLLARRKLQRGTLNAGRNLPKRRGRPLQPWTPTAMRGTWCTLTPPQPQPLPKVLTA